MKHGRILPSILRGAVLVLACASFFGGQRLAEADRGRCPEAVTIVEMRECLDERYAQANRELNRAYTQLRSKLDTPRQATLRDAQRAWIAFRDTSAEFEAGEEKGGSLYSITYLSVLLSKTEQRVDELKTLLEGMEVP